MRRRETDGSGIDSMDFDLNSKSQMSDDIGAPSSDESPTSPPEDVPKVPRSQGTSEEGSSGSAVLESSSDASESDDFELFPGRLEDSYSSSIGDEGSSSGEEPSGAGSGSDSEIE